MSLLAVQVFSLIERIFLASIAEVAQDDGQAVSGELDGAQGAFGGVSGKVLILR